MVDIAALNFESEEAEEKFVSAYNATVEYIKKLVPKAEVELTDRLGIHIWIPYTDLDADDNLLDRGITVGIVYFIDEDTGDYVDEEEVHKRVDDVISRFKFVQNQICDAINYNQ
jgi:hypothetical protein